MYIQILQHSPAKGFKLATEFYMCFLCSLSMNALICNDVQMPNSILIILY